MENEINSEALVTQKKPRIGMGLPGIIYTSIAVFLGLVNLWITFWVFRASGGEVGGLVAVGYSALEILVSGLFTILGIISWIRYRRTLVLLSSLFLLSTAMIFIIIVISG